MIMKKSEKRLENALIKALNNICEILKDKYEGFCWLTHFVDHTNVSQSLKLVFVFKTNHALETAKNNDLFKDIFMLTESHLKRESITVKRIDKAVFFDTEENGADFENLKWCRRFS